MHFHWGDTDEGSEHTINHKRYTRNIVNIFFFFFVYSIYLVIVIDSLLSQKASSLIDRDVALLHLSSRKIL